MKIHDLFDLEKTAHAALFENHLYGWEVLPYIAGYIEKKVKHEQKKILVGKNTIIEPGAVIKENVIIGDNTIVRSGAYIRENSIIGNDCIVGNSTEIKNAILFDHVQVPHYNYVGDSILGYKVHLGASVVLSNFKSSQSTVAVMVDGEKVDTGLEKCGAYIGDFADIGSGAVLSPGAIIGRETVIYPLAFIRGTIPEKSIVKIRQQQEIIKKEIS